MRWTAALIVLTLLAPSALARKLPKHRPADFSVSYSMSYGMRGGGVTVILAASGSYDRYGVDLADPLGGKSVSATFTMTDDELDQLYAKLRKASPERVRSKQEKISDRGGVSITITAGNHTWELADAGMSVVIARDRKRFAKIRAIVEDVIATKEPASPDATQ